jgi:alkanesulfonate monooxygenase SsuD/methylene tetrahydromethanopterin reductase-like flavin-dependent oxidoreductase (luciferase family)
VIQSAHPISANEKPIRIGALLWPQGTDWPGIRAATLEAEKAGFDSLWTSDHLLSPTGPLQGPVFEGWSLITALGVLTNRATVGLIVSGNTLRHPALVAKMAVTLDHVTNGRAVCGLGAGWAEEEHRVHGIDFGRSPGDRIDRLHEAALIIRGLLDGASVDSRSSWYTLDSVRHSPLPVQNHLPMLIGGEGRRKTLRIVAELADQWNARGSLDSLIAADAVLRQHCSSVGRSSDAIERLTNRWVVVRTDEDAARQFVTETMQYQGLDSYDESTIVCGPPRLVADALIPLVNAGFRHLIWSLRAPWDMETIQRMPEVRELVSSGSREN